MHFEHYYYFILNKKLKFYLFVSVTAISVWTFWEPSGL